MKITAELLAKWRHQGKDRDLRQHITGDEWEDLCELALKGLAPRPEGLATEPVSHRHKDGNPWLVLWGGAGLNTPPRPAVWRTIREFQNDDFGQGWVCYYTGTPLTDKIDRVVLGWISERSQHSSPQEGSRNK